MKKFLLVILVLLVPGITFAQSALTNFPVGTCKQIEGGYWQQMPDGTWASPNDQINTCRENGFIWNNQYPYSPYNSPYGYNPQLADMDTGKWILMCLLLSTVLPQSQCQAHNPYFANSYNQLGGLNSYLQYPSFGRDYLALGGERASIYVDLSSSKDKWKSVLLGVGMGWLFDRLTS